MSISNQTNCIVAMEQFNSGLNNEGNVDFI